MKPHDRHLGCLLGLAVGDSVGTTLEFKAPGSFKPVTDLVGGGPFNLKAGEWTDDTSMALCLAESLIKKDGFDAQDQMERYCRWSEHGYMSSTGVCFDIGNTVSQALRRFRISGEALAGSTDTYSAGNGSLMRLAPVPMFYAANGELAVEFSGQSSLTTHGAVACVDACRYFGGLLWGALNGEEKESLLSPDYSPCGGVFEIRPLCPEVKRIAAGSFKVRNPPEIRGTGYVVQSLEAALWAFYSSSDFRAGCLMAANLGDDADTTAAIYGQLAGAYYGCSGIPDSWLDQLKYRPVIMQLAELLAAHGMKPKVVP